VKEDNEIFPCTAFGIVQANITNLCKAMIDGEVLLGIHGVHGERENG
jgi:hypothetical protein